MIVRRDEHRRYETIRLDTHSRALAAASVWSKEAGRALSKFEKGLKPKETHKPETVSMAEIKKLYESSGIQATR